MTGVEGAKKGLVPFWISTETFWNSLDALSNSFLAWATILASSGIFCGPHRKKTRIIAAMVPSSRGSKAILAISGLSSFEKKRGEPGLLRLAEIGVWDQIERRSSQMFLGCSFILRIEYGYHSSP